MSVPSGGCRCYVPGLVARGREYSTVVVVVMGVVVIMLGNSISIAAMAVAACHSHSGVANHC